MVSEVKQTNFTREEHWINFTTVFQQNGKSKYTVAQGLKMDWTEDAGLHQWFKDWKEETELI